MAPLWVPTPDDFVVAAAVILQTSEEAIRQLPRLHLAESALAAPFAGYDETEAYPSLLDKAAVLIDRIARNHPLPDGNKRTALAITILFLERNGRPWASPTPTATSTWSSASRQARSNLTRYALGSASEAPAEGSRATQLQSSQRRASKAKLEQNQCRPVLLRYARTTRLPAWRKGEHAEERRCRTTNRTGDPS